MSGLPVHIFQYCHYVAGLVGIGLSRLISLSGLEDESLGQDEMLASSMGLFLQKVNVIQDHLEDFTQGRQFWPQEVYQLGIFISMHTAQNINGS